MTKQEHIVALFRQATSPPADAHVFAAVYDRAKDGGKVVVAEVWSTTNSSSNPAVKERIMSVAIEHPYKGPAPSGNGAHRARHDHDEALSNLLAALKPEEAS